MPYFRTFFMHISKLFKFKFAVIANEPHILIKIKSEKDLEQYAWGIQHSKYEYWVPVPNELKDVKEYEPKCIECQENKQKKAKKHLQRISYENQLAKEWGY